jgi:hypothetical protein
VTERSGWTNPGCSPPGRNDRGNRSIQPPSGVGSGREGVPQLRVRSRRPPRPRAYHPEPSSPRSPASDGRPCLSNPRPLPSAFRRCSLRCAPRRRRTPSGPLGPARGTRYVIERRPTSLAGAHEGEKWDPSRGLEPRGWRRSGARVAGSPDAGSSRWAGRATSGWELQGAAASASFEVSFFLRPLNSTARSGRAVGRSWRSSSAT